MGTLNISSMGLQAVNVQRVLPGAARKKKGPRYKAPPVSRTRKVLMVTGAVSLLALAFLLPPASDLQSAITGNAEAGISQAAAATDEAQTAPAPVMPQRLSSTQFARNRVVLQAAPSAPASGLEPLSQALPFAPSTVGDTAVAITVLTKYLQNGTDEEKREARLRLDSFRSENVQAALLSLIRSQEDTGLAVSVSLATELKVPQTLDALCDRIQSTKQKPYARPELLKALTTFSGSPKADALIDTLLNGSDAADRDNLWNTFSAPMPAKCVNLAFERVLTGHSDAAAATFALGRHGQTSEAAFDILSRAEKHLQNPDAALRLRMVKLMCELEINTVAPRLGMVVYDSSDAVRQAVVTALSRSHTSSGVLIQMLQSDESLAVKQACLDGLGGNPVIGKEALYILAGYLNHPTLRHAAKRALVQANQGTDLGWQEVEWVSWIESL